MTAAAAAGAPAPCYPMRVEAHPRAEGTRVLSATEITDELSAQADSAQPWCIYVHVPYCRFRCSFCALYTKLLRDDPEPVVAGFTASLIRSIEQHPWGRKQRSPTTVHFGGGTPLAIGAERLASVVDSIRSQFTVDPACEWAIETTTSSLDAVTVERLREMGFRRLHLGVQTLDDAVRRRTGRQEDSATVLKTIALAIERGFDVSVDLILGLDGTDATTLRRDVDELFAAGIRMFSICELRLQRGQLSPRQHRQNYSAWQSLWSQMRSLGLAPIHIGQFGRSQDDNLYFTHPARGEACMVLGPYGHGSFGDYTYQNQLLGAFERSVGENRLPVIDGLYTAPAAQLLVALEQALLAHRIPATLLTGVLEQHESDLLPLLQQWERAQLLSSDDASGELVPTCDGSWYVGNMVRELRACSHGAQAA